MTNSQHQIYYICNKYIFIIDKTYKNVEKNDILYDEYK